MKAKHYRHSDADIIAAWIKWLEACPHEKHQVVSFVAGYNAAFADTTEIDEASQREIDDAFGDAMFRLAMRHSAKA